jgi:hypothetical protein
MNATGMRRTLLLAGVIWVSGSRAASAQQTGASGELDAGSQAERYLRARSLVDSTLRLQQTIRPFGPEELRGIGVPDSAKKLRTVPARASLLWNSSTPYGFNDGPVWSGKGVTLAVTGGLSYQTGHLTATLRPLGFVAENGAFSLGSNGLTGDGAFADWRHPNVIDLPQRFGSGVYFRIDPGETEIRWDQHGVSAGISSRAESWGPAIEHPIILGPNAGGIPRIFLGTSHPLDAGPITIHGRLFWGRIDASPYAVGPSDHRWHPATGAAGSIGIRGVPGLELGAARFFHLPRPSSLGEMPWLRVFEGLLKDRLISSTNPLGDSPDNQLASAYFRWGPPGSSMEVYGEFAREDHNANLRGFIKEPDHDAAYLVGVQRAWRSGGSARPAAALRVEILNSRISHLQQAISQTEWYTHGSITEGHTLRGQILGSAAGYGGGAAAVVLDRYSAAGRTTFRWDRMMVAEQRNLFGLPVPSAANVIQALGVERVRLIRGFEVAHGVTWEREFNRHFQGDATNLTLSVSASRR